jgi:hypothetical protein
MREDRFHIIGVLAVVALTCASFSCKPSLDRAAARSFSDSFVSDLDQNRMDEALKKVDPELIRLAGSYKVMAALKQARDVCDGPLTSQFQFDEIGFYVTLDGRQMPTRTFHYGAGNDKQPHYCAVTVKVFPGSGDGYTVGTLNAKRR